MKDPAIGGGDADPDVGDSVNGVYNGAVRDNGAEAEGQGLEHGDGFGGLDDTPEGGGEGDPATGEMENAGDFGGIGVVNGGGEGIRGAIADSGLEAEAVGGTEIELGGGGEDAVACRGLGGFP
ncbi:hypothetical protein IEQ34_012291 [Dendrobium chrysotoxum]|uniref:Uncharacterized protein n=1 Tax=Dendrobium chrysotoxum TaxID=161865 RepID=A0AAV7GSV3_DENCH|nr:hypothetical protein IEQ34_012291 [Dendrobium chrysotoxum]